jgi:hypothetical protein
MKVRKPLRALTIICLFSMQSLLAQNPNFEWVKQIEGTSHVISNSMAIDGSGNIYTTGYFEGIVDFDPGIGTAYLNTGFNYLNIFIQKLDSSGNFCWAKQMGGGFVDIGNSIMVDSVGNIYTIGVFQGTVDFDPDTGISNLTSHGGRDVFVQKLDANGNFLWTKNFGGSSNDDCLSSTLDESNNIYITGFYQGTADFNPGLGNFMLTSVGSDDIYIQKLDNHGNFVWAKSIGGSAIDRGQSIAVDKDKNIYVTGFFRDSVDFNTGLGTTILYSAGASDIFIQKLDSNGNFNWVKSMGGPLDEYGNTLKLDAFGNIYTIGYFNGTLDFNPGTGTNLFTSIGMADIFIQKLTKHGNYSWAKQMGGLNNDYGMSIAVDASSNCYSTGFFEGVSDFNPGSATAFLTSSGGSDIFVQKLDSNGSLTWAKHMGGAANDESRAIVVDHNKNIFSTGNFQGTADFDPGVGTTALASAGLTDVYIHKLNQSTNVGLIENSFQENIQVYPNPNNGHFSIQLSTQYHNLNMQLKSINGQLIERREFSNTDLIQMKINQPAGIYLVEVMNDAGDKAVFKVVRE